MLVNLSQHSAIQVAQLGNKWFVDVVLGNDSTTLAQVDTQEEADGLVQQIFDSLHAGEKAFDLNPTQENTENKEASNSHHTPPAAPKG